MTNDLHQELAATYAINGRTITVFLCWTGPTASADSNRFYDLYEQDHCLNLGEPWYDNEDGAPSLAEVRDFLEGA